MKKRTGIGIGIAIVVFVILFGIASLPDEVLIESPSIDTSASQTGEEKTVTLPPESISSTDQPESEEPPVEQVEQPESEEETQENVIKIKIRDGVGTGDR